MLHGCENQLDFTKGAKVHQVSRDGSLRSAEETDLTFLSICISKGAGHLYHWTR